jgi:shikimate dehydrogenase
MSKPNLSRNMDFLKLGLLGWPLEHSLSPVLHSTFLASSGLNGQYKLFPLPSGTGEEQGLKSLFHSLRSGKLLGLNVTIPYKQTVIPLLDELSSSARRIGAVNTISLNQNRLYGDNTDGLGFLTDLTQTLSLNSAPSTPETALVIGAGGSARAVVEALSTAGWLVTIAARRIDQAQFLMLDLSESVPKPIKAIHLDPRSLAMQSPRLIVNTTPVGMYPNHEASPWPGEIPFPIHASLYDLVYNPVETALVRQARQAGLTATSGIGMLVEQAALSFQIWTGLLVTQPVKDLARQFAMDLLSNNPIQGSPG